MFRFALGAMLLLAPLCSAAADVAGLTGEPLPPFKGRSGATKEKIITVCTIPDRAQPRDSAGWLLDLAVQVKNAAVAEVHRKLLRELTQGGSSDWLGKPPKNLDELLKQVPPKYREMVKEYFEKLERMQKK